MYHRFRRRGGFSLPGLIVLAVLALGLLALMILRFSASRRGPAVEVSAYLAPTPAVSTAAGNQISVPPTGPAASAAPGDAAPGDAAPEPTAAPTPTPVPEPEYFTVSMVGDCTLAEAKTRRGWGSAYQSVVGTDYAYPFANTVEYFRDDYLTITNLECTLSNTYYDSIEQFVFLAPAAYANILSEGGVDFVTLANNHTMDFGQNAYNDTKASLDAAGIPHAGEDEIYIFQRDDGVKIGLYCLYNQLTYNAMSIKSANGQQQLVAAGKEKIKSAQAALMQAGAEFTVACLHMGREGYYETTDTQVELCRYAVDQGFGLIYCSHAHRLQPAEPYNGALIFYGLGNWSFGGHTNPGNGTDPGAYDTGIAQVTLCRRGDRVTIDSYTFIPCCISSSAGTGLSDFVPNANTLNNYQPTPYAEGGSAWNRTLSMLNGTYEGANYNTDYSNVLTAMNNG